MEKAIKARGITYQKGTSVSDFSDEEGEYVPEWYPYENGQTMGRTGPENGSILADEERGDPDDEEDADARLTLEQNRSQADRFMVSATLYGWMYHTTTIQTETEARQCYELMRTDLEALSELLPYEEDGPRAIEQKTTELLAAIADFEARYPS